MSVPDHLGRFDIEGLIGEGGMGAVYRATDRSDGQTVAIKVLRNDVKDIAQSIRRFRKEARLLADAQNEHVTRLIDVGQDQGFHFIAMEYIDGIDLKQWLSGRGPIPESDALNLTASLARALVEAHCREVVHRDIKPENVLLQLKPEFQCYAQETDDHPINHYNVKLTDFGIARHVSQSESMEMTRAGAVLGTPKYMSPEQCKSSGEIGPAADVYSLGITFYQLLTGQVPFDCDDYMKLAAMHCFDRPIGVQKTVSEISDATARIVDRMLEKSPEDRFGDASQLLEELLQTIRGEAACMEAHPRTPDHDASKLWEKTVSWDLGSEPATLWPFISNTERLNEAIGLPPVEYTTKNDPRLGVRKFGTFTLSGVKISWEEHPFEWIEGHRMGILREFETGPFKWFMSVVTLEKRAGGGTRLSHQVRIEPRNLLGRMLVTVEADWKGFRNLNRAYQRMDEAAQSRLKLRSGSLVKQPMDPFSDSKPPTSAQQKRLSQAIDLAVKKGVSPEAADAVFDTLRHAAAQDLGHIRPLALADQFGVQASDMVDGCLIAATVGLLQLRWDILCPTCRVSASTSELLSNIESHTHCEACNVDFKSNLGDAIEMVFRAHPEIRNVNDGQYCVGGPEHSPHVVAQVRVEPGECLRLPLDLDIGEYLIRGSRLTGVGRIRVQSSTAPSTMETTLSKVGNHHVQTLRMGRQKLTIVNDLANLQIVRLERTIPRSDVINAAMASANPVFRKLFPEQNFAVDNPMETEVLSLMTSTIASVDELYAKLGDAKAYQAVRRYQEAITSVVDAAGGTVVKTMGEYVLAVFERREQSVRAALDVRQVLADQNEPPIKVGVGVHSGPTLVTTQNNRLDYFGVTVRAANSLPALAGPDTLITEATYNDTSIRELLSSSMATIETVDLAGCPGTRVKRILADSDRRKKE
ncbi:protein kinase [Rhodopirellula sp. JC740]|uniref:Protein kinase n=1 Tax=Rhodopirellula halodulae TaxID=2894198 RepID=A0ABS8NN59_9BACT|nr:protein kinase [Rhodopirellula sp. JC740]MCC9645003.1 protein kinase [Rhodopirellula sp. JC740]